MISEAKILDDNMKWKFERIEADRKSYWKQTEADYGIEEYSFEDVPQLGQVIAEKTGINLETAKSLAVEAFRRYYGNDEQKREQENKVSALPDFVYML